MTTRWFSLRRRLLALLLGGVTLAWLLTLILSYVDAHHEVDELFDAQLAQSAQTLLALSSHEPEEANEELGEAAHKYQRRLRFQVWSAQGVLLLHSKNSPGTALTAAEGFSETHDHEGRWRHFSQWDSTRSRQVQVSENHQIRDELIRHITGRLVFPALFGLPLLGLWVWLATRQGLSPLNDLARQIADRAPQQLVPLAPATAPEEIRPMLEALNALFQRVEFTLAAEQRFTADAAHELRTPLAALLAQVQVALQARQDSERQQALQHMQQGLQRATHLIEQMLQLARLDPQCGLPASSAVDLAELAESVCAELGQAIFDKPLDFALNATSCQVSGQAEWLRILIRNLVDNGIRYTPPHGHLQVDIKKENGQGILCVSDSGPGIPAGQRAAVLRRFHRLPDAEAGGCGLGLSIVARIVELHGARLSLEDAADGHGLKVTVWLKLHA